MKRSCMVMYDDDDGIRSPYGWDDDCPGAIAYSDEPVIFPNRVAARRAIRISQAYAKLCQAQSRPVNTDFTTELKHVRIVDVVIAQPDGGES